MDRGGGGGGAWKWRETREKRIYKSEGRRFGRGLSNHGGGELIGRGKASIDREIVATDSDAVDN